MRGGRWGRRIGAVLAAVLAPVGASGVVPASEWTLVDLGTLGGSGSYATAVSNSGHVVGCSDTPGGEAHAFIYTDGTMRGLPGANGAAGSSCGLAVSNDGTVAGRSATGELVIWRGGGVHGLGVQGDIGGMNDAGVVVGAYREGPRTVAFKYANGSLEALADAGASSFASRINARGQVVGTANGRAFLHENGLLLDLGTLGGNGSSARGLNDRGDVVGMSADANGQPHAFVYDGTMRALPAPAYSGAVAINNRGQVIGSAEGTHGYLIEGGRYVELGSLTVVREKGWRRLQPAGINDRGWIAGTAMDAAGDFRAFLLMPPEPPVASLTLSSPRMLARSGSDSPGAKGEGKWGPGPLLLAQRPG